MKFIVVDDNKAFRERLKFYIETKLFHEVIGLASSGEEFLKMKNSFDADIIFIDLKIPNLNGIETIKKALWDNSYLKFIAVTDYKHKIYLSELLSAGFKACIFKSGIYGEIKKAIDVVINNRLHFPKAIIKNEN